MPFEKAKQLKDAGFPQWDIEHDERYDDKTGEKTRLGYMVAYSEEELKDTCVAPKLEALIEQCGKAFKLLKYEPSAREEHRWRAVARGVRYEKDDNHTIAWRTPDVRIFSSNAREAVADLYIAIHKK